MPQRDAYVDLVNFLVEKCKADVNYRDRAHRNQRPLHVACDIRDAKVAEGVAEALLKRGAKVNVADAEGKTPLYSAARRGHAHLLKMLLAKGAKVNAQTREGTTALMRACTGRPDPGPVRVLLAAGAQVDHRDLHGETALMKAAATSHTGVVRLLIGSGASVFVKSLAGLTALHL